MVCNLMKHLSSALGTEDQTFDTGPLTSLSSCPPVQLSLLLLLSNQSSHFLVITPCHYPYRFLAMCSDLFLVSGPLCETYSRCLATVCLVASSTHCVFVNNLHSNLVKLNQKSNQTFCTLSAPLALLSSSRTISRFLPQVRPKLMSAPVILKGHDTCSPLHSAISPANLNHSSS